MAAKVGLTGGMGSGKSTVATLFADRGVQVVDADKIARKLTRPGTPALLSIAAYFGNQVLKPDGSLDRSALSQTVFACEDQRRWLEHLLHPMIRKEMDQHVERCADPYCILEVPLLIETNRQGDMDYVVVVHCPRDLRIERLMASRNMLRQDVERIMDQQTSDHKRLKAADFLLINDADLATLKVRFESLFTILASRHC